MTVFVAVMTVALLMASGLVLDGGRLLAARQEATDAASAAARAGAQAVDVAALRSGGTVSVEPASAATAARRFLASRGLQGDVYTIGDRVHVSVEIRRPTALLGLVGISSLTVSGEGSARIVRGVTGAET